MIGKSRILSYRHRANCVDEVESLTAARSAAMNGSEPGDAVRVRFPS